LRPKRHDSINGIIAETCRSSQRLDALPASRDAACGFFAASLLVPDRFLCKQATVAEQAPNGCHVTANRTPQRYTPG
jgi:hypothetical protein